MKHGQDARATSAHSGFCKSLNREAEARRTTNAVAGQDETPWPATIEEPFPGPRVPTIDITNIPTALVAAREWFLSRCTDGERREALRLLLNGDAAGIALALALYWTSAPEEGLRRDFLIALGRDAPVPLVRWLFTTHSAASDKMQREALFDLMSNLRGTAAVAAMVTAALEGDDPIERRKLAELLSRRHTASEISSLEDTVWSADTVVAEAAAAGLASIGGTQALHALVSVAEAGANADAIAKAISESHSPFSQSALLDLAADTRRASALRVAAVQALSAERSERVRAALRNWPTEQNNDKLNGVVGVALDQLEGGVVAHSKVWAGDDPNSDDATDERWFLTESMR